MFYLFFMPLKLQRDIEDAKSCIKELITEAFRIQNGESNDPNPPHANYDA